MALALSLASAFARRPSAATLAGSGCGSLTGCLRRARQAGRHAGSQSNSRPGAAQPAAGAPHRPRGSAGVLPCGGDGRWGSVWGRPGVPTGGGRRSRARERGTSQRGENRADPLPPSGAARCWRSPPAPWLASVHPVRRRRPRAVWGATLECRRGSAEPPRRRQKREPAGRKSRRSALTERLGPRLALPTGPVARQCPSGAAATAVGSPRGIQGARPQRGGTATQGRRDRSVPICPRRAPRRPRRAPTTPLRTRRRAWGAPEPAARCPARRAGVACAVAGRATQRRWGCRGGD